MERSIRMGKDFNVRWSIRKRVDGEGQPYELAGKELVLQYRRPNGTLHEAKEWRVEGNIIIWTFRGRDQKAPGLYGLILTENGGKDGMVTVDTCRAFNLVAHSCEETEGSGSDIVIEDVVLESEVAFAPIVIEGGGGGSYDDTEIKEDIADLQAKDAEQSAKLAELSEELASNGVLIEDLQNTKIDRENDDYYPKMAVGLADNLAGVDVVDSEINFRRSGGGAISDGVARIESIKGNSVVWNQVFKANESTSSGFMQLDGDTMVITSKAANGVNWGVISSKAQYVIGHKYRIAYEVISGDLAEGRNYFQIGGLVTIQPNTDKIVTSSSLEGKQTVALRVTPESVGARFKIKITDLTQMFGAGNEPTTIEEFYARIPMGVDMNAYNEGEVIHMDVQSIESVGVNQWDEEWELGSINVTTGENVANAANFRCTNYIDILGGTKYYGYNSGKDSAGNYYAWGLLYNSNKQLILDPEGYGRNYIDITNRTFPTPQNARYMRFYVAKATQYNHNISIHLNDTSINGQYFPHIKRVEDLSLIRKYFPQGMRSAGTAHDEIRYNKTSGKKEYSKGRLKSVDLGTLNFARSSTGIYYCEVLASAIKDAKKYGSNILCAKYTTHRGELAPAALPDKSLMLYNGAAYPLLGINDTAYTDAASFKAAMQGVILYYEAAEWEWVELDEADQFKDLDYAVWNDGTEKAIAEGKSAPLAADITYGFNAIGKIKELESLVAALRAKVGI